MGLQFMFFLTTRAASWLRLSRREETGKTAEILILRHQLTVLQRQQARRPNLNWADRALLATLIGVLPKTRRRGLRLLVTPDTIVRWHRDIARRRWAARSIHGKTGRPATRRKHQRPWSSDWPARTPNGATAGSTGNWPGWEWESRRRRYGDLEEGPNRPRAAADRPSLVAVLRSQAEAILASTSSQRNCPAARRLTSWP